jgi:Lipopolysaccharide-assembly
MEKSSGRYIAVAIVIMAVLLSFGCGYRFSPGGEYIDQNIKTVYIEPFVNKTSEANIENIFRAAFVDWFISRGNRFKVVDQASTADAIWRGSINTVSTIALSYQTTNLAKEERMTVVMDLQFAERESKKEIWADRAFAAFQDYPIADALSTESARKNALSKLSVYAAEKAYRAMMSGF